MGRGALRFHRAERGRTSHGSRDYRVLPQSDVGLQDAEDGRVRAYSKDIDRQNPEVHAAQSGGIREGDFGLSITMNRCWKAVFFMLAGVTVGRDGGRPRDAAGGYCATLLADHRFPPLQAAIVDSRIPFLHL